MLIFACASGFDWDAAPVQALPGRIACLFLAMISLGLLIYTLFFAFPLGSAYAAPGERRPACRDGVYALCRHPGVLWLFFLLFFSWLGAGLALRYALSYTALNVLLVLFEDRLVFPSLLSGYEDYRRETPFLLPSVESLRRCLRRR